MLIQVCESLEVGQGERSEEYRREEGGSRKSLIHAFVDLGPLFFALCLKHLALCLGTVDA